MLLAKYICSDYFQIVILLMLLSYYLNTVDWLYKINKIDKYINGFG